MQYLTNIHEFTSDELRDIIFGRATITKCPACDKEGKCFGDENGNIVQEETDYFEWCEECNGLAYIIRFIG